jgi:hypothetical protein
MKSIVQVIIKDKNGLVAEHSVASDAAKTGSQLVIKAKGNVTYELKDIVQKYAPNQVLAKRKGKNLEINLDVDGNVIETGEMPDIVIENYYEESTSKLIGLAEDGNYYPYVPQEGETSLLTYNMPDGVFAYQSLGQLDTAIVGIPWLPTGLGALAVAGIAAAAGGGGGTKNIAPTAIGNTSGDEDTNIPIILAGIDTDGTIDHITIVALPF